MLILVKHTLLIKNTIKINIFIYEINSKKFIFLLFSDLFKFL